MRDNINTVSAADNNGRFIFVSYSSKDKEIVDSDCAELRRHNVPLWIDDKLAAGFDWRYALKKIRSKECVGVIFYISENSIISKAVQKELRTAAKRFGKSTAVDKDSKERIEGYFSVNIGEKSPQDIKKAMLAEKRGGHVKREFLKHFNNNVIYIPRKTESDNFDHFEKLLDMLEMYDIMVPGVCDNFKYEITPEGAVICGYEGTSDCVSIPEQIIGINVAKIANDAFKGISFIRKLHVPETVKVIGEGAFRHMDNLSEIHLPKELHHLGEAAFRETPSLKTIELPLGLKKLEQAMFKDSGITSLTIPDGTEYLDEAMFVNCAELESLVIPDSVRKMTEGGFKGCTKLRDLTIPENIEGLNEWSFSDCPLVDVTIGKYHYHDCTADLISDTDPA